MMMPSVLMGKDSTAKAQFKNDCNRLKLKNPKFTEILYESQDLKEKQAKELAKSLKDNPHVTVIRLGGNQLSVNGIKEIVAVLPTLKSLVVLDLRDVGFNDECAKALGESLKSMHTLEALDLGSNKISDRGLDSLAGGIRHLPVFYTLSLDMNPGIRDNGAEFIAMVLPHMHSIKRLNLSHCSIGKRGADCLMNALCRCRTLEDLDLKKNNSVPTEARRELKRTLNQRMGLTIANDGDEKKDGGGGTYILEGSDTSTEVCHMPTPEVPASFPALENFSGQDLERLMHDTDAFTSFVESLGPVQAIMASTTSLSEENIRTAEANLRTEEDFRALHREAAVLKQTLAQKTRRFEQLERQQLDLLSPPDTNGIIMELRKLQKRAFQDSEEIAASWIDDGSMDVDEFLEQFLEQRVLQHERAAKIEKLTQ